MKHPEQPAAPDALLKVEGLVKHFPIKKGLLRRTVGAVQAVDGLTFDVRPGETLGVVGESGCGKSTMGRLITRLLEPTGGRIEFEGHDITHLGVGKMRPLRRDVQMIFQDPYSSLNPRHTIGTIVSAPFKLQGVRPEGGVKQEVQRLLELVGLNPEHYNRYPHEFSGGQRQRIGIARALALKPKLVVADEPVSALDVSIQAQVVNLLDDLQDELGLTYVIIAHDLSVIRHVSDRIAVMYLGKIVELADRKSLYEAPMHPYTKALMSAVPVPDPRRRGVKNERILLKGDVPSPISPPTGCRFHTRCWKATEICKKQEPPLIALRPGQQVACHHPENAEDQAPEDVALASAREAIEIVAATPKSEESARAEKTPAAVATKSPGAEAGAGTTATASLSKAPAAEAEAGTTASAVVPKASGAEGASAKVAGVNGTAGLGKAVDDTAEDGDAADTEAGEAPAAAGADDRAEPAKGASANAGDAADTEPAASSAEHADLGADIEAEPSVGTASDAKGAEADAQAEPAGDEPAGDGPGPAKADGASADAEAEAGTPPGGASADSGRAGGEGDSTRERDAAGQSDAPADEGGTVPGTSGGISKE